MGEIKILRDCEKSYNTVQVHLLIRIYHYFLEEPKRTFIKKDFLLRGLSKVRSYLFTLEKLGLIERVMVYYPIGKKGHSRNNTQGYRLKKEDKKIEA